MTHHRKLLFASASALLFFGLFAGANTAQAAALKCECTDLDKCVLDKGRESSSFDYNPNNPGAYDAIEADAMQKADAKAAAKGEAAYDKWSNAGLQCPAVSSDGNPCDSDPEIWWKHGKPFAGATGGHGEGRSLWKVSYICRESEEEDEDEDDSGDNGPNFNILIGGGGHWGHDHDHGDHHHDGDHHDHDHGGKDHGADHGGHDKDGDHGKDKGGDHGGKDHGGDHHDGQDKGGKHDHDKGDKGDKGGH